jgi:hypothetical protein
MLGGTVEGYRWSTAKWRLSNEVANKHEIYGTCVVNYRRDDFMYEKSACSFVALSKGFLLEGLQSFPYCLKSRYGTYTEKNTAFQWKRGT